MKKEKVAPIEGATKSAKAAKAIEALNQAVSILEKALLIQENRSFPRRKLSAREKSFLACAMQNFLRAQRAYNEVMGITPRVTPIATNTATKKHRIHEMPVVEPEMEDEWLELEEAMTKVALGREQSRRKVTRDDAAHPKCSYCGSRHCGWDHHRNTRWGRPAKPSKARK